MSRSQYLIVDKPNVDVLIQSLWRFNIWKSLVCFNVIVNTKVTLKHQWRIQRYMNLHVLWDYESSLKYFNWWNLRSANKSFFYNNDNSVLLLPSSWRLTFKFGQSEKFKAYSLVASEVFRPLSEISGVFLALLTIAILYIPEKSQSWHH